MQKQILIFFFLMVSLCAISQEITRIEVAGKVVVETNDKEGITVYNTSSNKGTITDENGNFKLKVALNDVVVFGALQFQDFTVIIDTRVLDSKRLTVFLVEEVNKLDEVLVLPYDLTGNLNADVESSRTFNVDMDAIYFGLENQQDFEFSADFKSGINNPSVDDQLPYMDNGLNVINFVGLIMSPLLKSKKRKQNEAPPKIPTGKLSERYDAKYLNTHFNIPPERADAFIAYVQEKGIKEELLEEGKEVQLLEYVLQQSKLFLKSDNDKE